MSNPVPWYALGRLAEIDRDAPPSSKMTIAGDFGKYQMMAENYGLHIDDIWDKYEALLQQMRTDDEVLCVTNYHICSDVECPKHGMAPADQPSE